LPAVSYISFGKRKSVRALTMFIQDYCKNSKEWTNLLSRDVRYKISENKNSSEKEISHVKSIVNKVCNELEEIQIWLTREHATLTIDKLKDRFESLRTKLFDLLQEVINPRIDLVLDSLSKEAAFTITTEPNLSSPVTNPRGECVRLLLGSLAYSLS